MRAYKVLEMINNDRIEELKLLLQDEIYKESLKTKPNAKKRYTAMRKYFTYVHQSREVLQKPCPIVFEDIVYTCFTNSWSLVLTTEPTGEIEMYGYPERYPNVTRLIRFDGIKKKINFEKVLAEAKSKGYKRTKAEVGHKFKYLMLYDGTYYKIGLIDITYSLIANGEETMTYHPDGEKMPLTIKNDIGLCIIMPVFLHEKDNTLEDKIVIEVE